MLELNGYKINLGMCQALKQFVKYQAEAWVKE